MKKLLLLITIISLIIVSCNKDDGDADVSGCTDPSAINFNSNANVEDGSCLYGGCKDPHALNYDSSADEEDGSCEYLASREKKYRNAVLEAYTGVRCTWCPEGHRRAQEFSDANPGRVIIVQVHTGGFASPLTGWPDFTTPFGPQLASQVSLTGYPAGTLNRYLYPGAQGVEPYHKQNANGLALSRGGYHAAGNYQLEKLSKANLGITSKWEPLSRKLTVTVEVYYVEGDDKDNRLNIVLTESNVVGRQIDLGVDNPNYIHNHVMRFMLTGQWGEILGTPSEGDRYLVTREYTVPGEFNINNCYISAYVTQGTLEIHNGARIAVIE